MRTPELGWHVQASRLNNESARFEGRIRVGMEDRFLEISIRPMLDEPGQRTGTYVCCDDVSAQDKLQTTVPELESTGEELQSANEELETINEELQSTNEELESTNEELKSLNDELEVRGQDLDQINDVYLRTLEKIRPPRNARHEDMRIEFWNTMALRLFGFRRKPPIALHWEQLPLPPAIRRLLIRRHRGVLSKQRPIVVQNQALGGKLRARFDIHLSLIPKEDHTKNVLIMFEPRAGIEGVDNKKRPSTTRGTR
ncbi:MAG TPA: hypothetical protein VE083_00730 [Terriglobales bacterium]|nr:hypothetical protein [Terriglobales bacterium]